MFTFKTKKLKWGMTIAAILVVGLGGHFMLHSNQWMGVKVQSSMRRVVTKMDRFENMLSNQVLPKANAAGTIADDMGNMVRMFYFMIAGYPGVSESATALTVTDGTTYRSMNNCTDTSTYPTLDDCDGPPATGLLSLYNQLILGYQDPSWGGVAQLMALKGISSCSDIPASGDLSPDAGLLEPGESITVMTATPVKVIPAGHTGADGSATYEKRLEIAFSGSGSGASIVVELNCPTAAEALAGSIQLYLGLNFAEGSDARILELFADKMVSSNQNFQFFMDFQSSSRAQNMALNMTISDTTGAMNFDMLMANQNGATDFAAFRFHVNGNVNDDDFSVAVQATSSAVNFATVASSTANTSVSVTGDYVSGSFESGKIIAMCLVGDGSGSYTGPTDGNIASEGACAGVEYAIAVPASAPAIDSSGTWTINWIAASAGLDAKIWNGVL